MKRVVLVFLKCPEEGRVKTRLAGTIGPAAAVVAYGKMVRRVLEQVRRANPGAIWIAYQPGERSGEPELRSWLAPTLDPYPGEVCWLEQSSGDLGDRLAAGASAVFAAEPEARLAVVGTDCVHLDRSLFEETWEALERNRVVFGPAEDGGFYLVGLGAACPKLFSGIPWSTESTLEASLERARELGLDTHRLPARFDVDTIEEWRRVEPELHRRRAFFFDRDGVVNRSPGPGYVLRWEDFHFEEGIVEVLRRLREWNWVLILVTSQKGVGKGLMSRAELDRIHRNMQAELAAGGAEFDGIYAYTGEPDLPFGPKPDPGMLACARDDFFLDLSRSWLVGDADRDIAMGQSMALEGTIRIPGDNPVDVSASHTLKSPAEMVQMLENIL